jgi:hypothetical protein
MLLEKAFSKRSVLHPALASPMMVGLVEFIIAGIV